MQAISLRYRQAAGAGDEVIYISSAWPNFHRLDQVEEAAHRLAEWIGKP